MISVGTSPIEAVGIGVEWAGRQKILAFDSFASIINARGSIDSPFIILIYYYLKGSPRSSC